MNLAIYKKMLFEILKRCATIHTLYSEMRKSSVWAYALFFCVKKIKRNQKSVEKMETWPIKK